MNTGTVSVRYAKALLEYAVELGQDEKVYAEMQILSQRLMHVRAIRDRLSDPTVDDESKCRLLETAVTDGLTQPSQALSRFLRLVIEAGRGNMLVFMATNYMDMYRKRNGIVPVQLITATPVGDERRERLKKLIETVEHGTPEWTHTVDPGLDGGFVLQIDGYRLDASVATRLQRIRHELIEKNNRVI
ncbi:MAG: F0F1 ATP synthase subunit delta [Bacteroidaceae bacterium]|nr:F0F1 ATP synthase subunit delta [Bacteroidaceae bacterium]